MHLFLRHATTDDAALIDYWDTKPHVRAATSETAFYDDWAREIASAPAWREIFIAQLDDRPVGLLHIIDPALEPARYWGDIENNLKALDIWIGEEADLDCGYGTVMMQLAHQHCFSDPDVTAIVIDPLASNVKAHRFYERLGYQFIEKRTFEDSESLVYRHERPAIAIFAQ